MHCPSPTAAAVPEGRATTLKFAVITRHYLILLLCHGDAVKVMEVTLYL